MMKLGDRSFFGSSTIFFLLFFLIGILLPQICDAVKCKKKGNEDRRLNGPLCTRFDFACAEFFCKKTLELTEDEKLNFPYSFTNYQYGCVKDFYVTCKMFGKAIDYIRYKNSLQMAYFDGEVFFVSGCQDASNSKSPDHCIDILRREWKALLKSYPEFPYWSLLDHRASNGEVVCKNAWVRFECKENLDLTKEILRTGCLKDFLNQCGRIHDGDYLHKNSLSNILKTNFLEVDYFDGTVFYVSGCKNHTNDHCIYEKSSDFIYNRRGWQYTESDPFVREYLNGTLITTTTATPNDATESSATTSKIDSQKSIIIGLILLGWTTSFLIN